MPIETAIHRNLWAGICPVPRAPDGSRDAFCRYPRASPLRVSADTTASSGHAIDFDENIMLSVFWPPTPAYINDEQYRLMADAGINWVLGAGEETLATPANQKKMLELCEKYGMHLILQDGKLRRQSSRQIRARHPQAGRAVYGLLCAGRLLYSGRAVQPERVRSVLPEPQEGVSGRLYAPELSAQRFVRNRGAVPGSDERLVPPLRGGRVSRSRIT